MTDYYEEHIRIGPHAPCAICGSTAREKARFHHFMRHVARDVSTGTLWQDAGSLKVCGACAANPPYGWRRIS